MSAAAAGDKRAPRVVLVDDHGLFRSGVRAELGRQVEVIGEADDVAPAIELIGRELPTWCCSTCTCRAAAVTRSSPR